jgi:1-hydroxycarotenoid 3,4-desaturase
VGPSGLALHHHNVFFGPDYRDEFSAIFERGELPETPTVYICAQDRGAAVDSPPPQGPERLLILVNAPSSGDLLAPSPADLDACEERTFAHLRRLGLEVEPSAPMIRTGPREFERLFPASGGALYGEANHRWNASLQRPAATTAIPGLFLAGGTAHPGAGVPMAALSGRLAAAAAAQAIGQKT